MTDLERELREIMHDQASQLRPPPQATQALVRRAKLQRTVTVAATSALVLAILAVGVAMGRSLWDTRADDPVDGPKVGTCRNVPAEVFAHHGWFDDSPVVACTKPHTTETVSVVQLAAPTVQAAMEFRYHCWQMVREYVGVDTDVWEPWGVFMYLPSREQVAAGASWVRCDVGLPNAWGSRQPFSLKVSVEDATDTQPHRMFLCLGRDPHVANQPYVTCTRPHMYEATGQIAYLEGLDSYPSPTQLEDESVQCRQGLPAKQQALDYGVTAVWDPPEAFSADTPLVGACFVYRQDGTPLGPHTH